MTRGKERSRVSNLKSLYDFLPKKRINPQGIIPNMQLEMHENCFPTSFKITQYEQDYTKCKIHALILYDNNFIESKCRKCLAFSINTEENQ